MIKYTIPKGRHTPSGGASPGLLKRAVIDLLCSCQTLFVRSTASSGFVLSVLSCSSAYFCIQYLGGDPRTRVAAGTLRRQGVASSNPSVQQGLHELLLMGPWRQFAFSIDARTVTRTAVPHSFQPREVRPLFRSVGMNWAQVKAALTAGQQELYGDYGVSMHHIPSIKR